MGSLFSKKVQKTSEEAENVTTSTSAPAPQATAEVDLKKEPVESDNNQQIHNRACFGAGCYWGTEKYFKINFARQMYPESMIKNTFVGELL